MFSVTFSFENKFIEPTKPKTTKNIKRNNNCHWLNKFDWIDAKLIKYHYMHMINILFLLFISPFTHFSQQINNKLRIMFLYSPFVRLVWVFLFSCKYKQNNNGCSFLFFLAHLYFPRLFKNWYQYILVVTFFIVC